jgi:hypothetical protein
VRRRLRYNQRREETPMSRKTARKYPEEMPEHPGLPETPLEDPQTLRKRQLARVLSHRGQIELDLDQETLASFWAEEGESRLATFDRQTAVSHDDAWD